MHDEDESPDFDEDETRRMERVLDDTEYDTELGVEMAKDAQRVAAGELEEAEFYRRYHEDILEEFGEDDRELTGLLDDVGNVDAGDGEGVADKLQALAEEKDVSRREVMKKGGAAVAALSIFASAGENRAAAAEGEEGGDEYDGTRWGMTINLNNCDGCLACMVACDQEHKLSGGANWMYVFTYEDDHQDDENFLVRPCQHCTESPCTKVCPVGARHTREQDGLVLTDYEICIGCRYCEVSCPYGVNYFQWGEPDHPQSEIPESQAHDDRGRWVGARPPEGVMGKCTFCVDRQDGEMGEEKIGTTACEEACAMDAIHFGDLNDPESDPNTHLEQYRDEQSNDLSKFKDRKEHTVSTFNLMEERGTKPNVRYVGNEPSPHAEQVEGPVSYEDVGLVDNRKEEVLDNGAMANQDGGEEA
ncbi:4Fe-4S ferredoxin N-terminal domain-containing protein [Halobacterium jilantaiense]|uniref:Prokaryotic molybdopterin-containing oxidoreductase family, iron-sulfur binding subunit n=1 Tax=Halobacterium jilantaiense TaxID=355548 RepID=A0A1I0PXX4_9EURY|nr:4Fe-4S ferredoxin N-terminal domain-containing protein [Halobacterium jilantaiense]SEW19452.1 prokaryotic molybdopterin-containing oxidoreductase family, iron-sulfur binding subunit [Halobacterium jilantaiense]